MLDSQISLKGRHPAFVTPFDKNISVENTFAIIHVTFEASQCHHVCFQMGFFSCGHLKELADDMDVDLKLIM